MLEIEESQSRYGRGRDSTMTDIDTLQYLHDATVHSIEVRIAADGSRDLLVKLTCNPDAGSPSWDGRDLMLAAHDVLIARAVFYGHYAGQEMLDDVSSAVDAATLQGASQLVSYGSSTRETALSLRFVSGSEIHLMCESINVELLPSV